MLVELKDFQVTAVNPRTKNLESQGLDAIRFVMLRGGIPRSREFPRNLDSEILSLRIPGMRADRTGTLAKS